MNKLNLQDKELSKNKFDHILSGFADFDKTVGGFTPGHLYAFCGRLAMGKTTMTVSLVKNIAIDGGHPVGLFSLEMTSSQIVQRLISNKLSVNMGSLNDGNRILSNIAEIENDPIFIDDTVGLDIHDLCMRAVRLVQSGVKIIFIDYLQLMCVQNTKFENRYHEIYYIVRTLKTLAKDLDISIVVMSQLYRSESRTQTCEEPHLIDLNDSASIAEYADVVSFLHRLDYYHIYVDKNGEDLHGKIKISVEKNRMGKNTSFYLNFNGAFAKISN